MRIKTFTLRRSTKGAGDFINITDEISEMVAKSGINNGSAAIFAIGSTCGITTFEYEPGLVKDMRDFYEKLVPSNKSYNHDATWGDANGFSHVRASLCGQSFIAPFENGKLFLGMWQQIVLAEFDNRARKREIIIQITGE